MLCSKICETPQKASGIKDESWRKRKPDSIRFISRSRDVLQLVSKNKKRHKLLEVVRYFLRLKSKWARLYNLRSIQIWPPHVNFKSSGHALSSHHLWPSHQGTAPCSFSNDIPPLSITNVQHHCKMLSKFNSKPENAGHSVLHTVACRPVTG
jgi:hypothetical protein